MCKSWCTYLLPEHTWQALEKGREKENRRRTRRSRRAREMASFPLSLALLARREHARFSFSPPLPSACHAFALILHLVWFHVNHICSDKKFEVKNHTFNGAVCSSILSNHFSKSGCCSRNIIPLGASVIEIAAHQLTNHTNDTNKRV